MRAGRRLATVVAAAVIAGAATVLGPAEGRAVADVYTEPGEHTVNGRRWLTECEPYSSSVERCETHIWATATKWTGRGFVTTTGWTWNNLTYKQSPRAHWLGNPLATPGEHFIDGRRWRTECDTAWTGSGGCRSMILASVPEYTRDGWRMADKWVFNNIVNFTYPQKGPGPKPAGPAAPATATVEVTGARHPGHPTGTLYTGVAPIAVTGRVSGAPAGVVVTLELRDASGRAWSTAYATTAEDGTFSAQLDSAFTGWAQLHARLENGNSGSLVTSIAAPTASVAAAATQIDPLGTSELTGSVVPAIGGVVVMPQVWANGTWTGIGSVRTAPDGTFRAPYEFNVGRLGAVNVRVRAATAPGAVWTSSNTATIERMRWANTAVTATTAAEVAYTYRAGCPVGISRLSTVRINHLGLDGLVHRGEIIVRNDLADDVARTFERSLAAGFPIGQMRNPNLWKGSDPAMMSANNSSGFNCRTVVGNPSAQSPHSYGIAVDINPWQNPYRDPTGRWWPSTAHVDRTPVVPGQLTSSSEPVVALKSYGWSWFSGWDWHHFEYRGYARTTTAQTLGAEPTPSATEAGSLTADSLPQPQGWEGVVGEGETEEGWTGNGTWTHAVDPNRKSVDLFALGCVEQPDVEAPLAALEGTLGADGRPGVTLALEFASDGAATAWLDAWRAANRGCGEVTVAVDGEMGWEAQRDLPDGLWSETAAADGAVVRITMLHA